MSIPLGYEINAAVQVCGGSIYDSYKLQDRKSSTIMGDGIYNFGDKTEVFLNYD